MSTPENIRRDARSSAVKELNRLAATIGEDAISTRAFGAKVQRLYETLCEQLDEAALGDHALARHEWADNGGGGDLRSDLLQCRELNEGEDFTDTSGVLPNQAFARIVLRFQEGFPVAGAGLHADVQLHHLHLVPRTLDLLLELGAAEGD